MILFEELSAKFPIRDVAPWGACLVVPGAEFNPDWEVSLGDLGYACHMTDYDGKPVTLVQKKKAVAEGKVVYVPPPKAEVPLCPDCNEPLKQRSKGASHKQSYMECKNENCSVIKIMLDGTVIRDSTATKPVQSEKAERTEALQARKQGGNMWKHIWTADEDKLLVALWNQTPKLTVAKIAEAVTAKFPERTAQATMNRITALQNEGRIQTRFTVKRKSKEAKKSPEKPMPEQKVTEATESTDRELELRAKMDRRIDILSESNDILSKAYNELKTEVIALTAFVQEHFATKSNVVFLRNELVMHKHAVSGEAMLPMEASE